MRLTKGYNIMHQQCSTSSSISTSKLCCGICDSLTPQKIHVLTELTQIEAVKYTKTENICFFIFLMTNIILHWRVEKVRGKNEKKMLGFKDDLM